MNGAVVWYQSRSVWGSVAALILLAATKFGIVLPASWTASNIVDFFLVAVPVLISLEGRITATKQVVASTTTANAVNAAIAAPAATAVSADANKPTIGSAIVPMLLCLLMVGATLPLLTGCTTDQQTSVNAASAKAQGSLDALYIAASSAGAVAVQAGKLDKASYKALDMQAYNALLAVRAARTLAGSGDVLTLTLNFNNAVAALRAAIPAQ